MATQEILPSDNISAGQPLRGDAAVLPFGNGNFAAVKDFLRQPAVQRALPAVGTVSALGLAALAWFSFQSPSQVPLFQGLPDADKSAVAEALQASGINYTIDMATGAITVDEDKLHQARILLAGQGLPKAAPAGDTLIASLPMGSSRAVEGETLRGAREADLSRTIEAIDAVKTARIHLATPEPSVFVRDQSAPAASVMLTLYPGRTLSKAQVRAMKHLVASSVPGMSPEQVSIVDQSGALLSNEMENNDDRNFQLQMQIETRYRESLNSLLAPIVGRNNYSVEVHADIDITEKQSTRETYPENDAALLREETNKQLVTNPRANEAVGVPGATANEPPQATEVNAQPPEGNDNANTEPTERQSSETVRRSYDVGREISVTHSPRGALQRVSVAVALNEPAGSDPRSDEEIKAIEDLVKGAVGYNAARGDIVAITSRPFVPVEEVETAFWDQPWFMMALHQLGAVLIALLVLFFVGRPIRKALQKRAEASEKGKEQLEQQLLEATGNPTENPEKTEITMDMIEAAPSYEARAEMIRGFVRQNPEKAALAVRQLIQEPQDG